MANLKHMNNDMAVSPIVATLVLIVVAVIGAVAVGTIMGTFSTDVSKKANTGDISGASSTEILIAGSTTVQPASELLAKAYMEQNPSMKINVQGGGSGAGVSSVGLGIVDIGSSSELAKITDAIKSGKEEYKNLQVTQIGGSAVVVIVNDAFVPVAAGDFNVTQANLLAAYTSALVSYATPADFGNIPSGTVLYTRGESSGTKDTFSEYISLDGKTKTVTDKAKPVIGNDLMASTIKTATGNALGFADYGVAESAKAKMLGIGAPMAGKIPSKSNILDALKTGTDSKYPAGMTRGLFYVTQGEPTSVVKNFITFASSPGANQYYNKAGMFGVTEFYATT
ncbi:MAG: substrate-binding domain-containing protein [Methanoregula sp.]|nr:substrate-binding domain-containing protein [Methanoregula sp.]